VPVDRAHPGRINQAHSVFEVRRRVGHPHLPHVLLILWVARLRDIGDEFLRSNGLHPAVLIGHFEPHWLSVGQDGHDRSERDDRGRQEIHSQEGIDQAGFAPFELAHHNQVEGIRANLPGELSQREPRKVLDFCQTVDGLEGCRLEAGIGCYIRRNDRLHRCSRLGCQLK